MSENKYGKYLLTDLIGKTPHLEVESPIIILNGMKQWGGVKLSMRISTITRPFVMESKSHVHDYDAYMCFIGGDPTNFRDFGAVVELALGEEREKQIITKNAIVYVPKGLYHCPLEYKQVDRPIMFLHIFPESEYERKTVE